MIYEIGWTRYDMTDFIIAACFIPVLIGFIIFIKKYKTEKGNFEKDGMISIGGSKNHTKFIVSVISIIFMLVSLSSMVKLFIKYKIINDYKNGEYEIFTGTATYLVDSYITLINEDERISFSNDNNTYNKDLEHILDKNIKAGKEYTIYFTCDYSYDFDYIILRIDSK